MSTAIPPYQNPTDLALLGEHARTLDGLGAMTLPNDWRVLLAGQTLVLVRGLDRCLLLLPQQQFQALRARANALPLADSNARLFRRHFFSGATAIEPDEEGNIRIPPVLRAYAGLHDAVIAAGVGNHAELWSAGAWQEVRVAFAASAQDAAIWDTLGI